MEQKRERQPIPIVALTAYAMPGDKQRCLDIGMTDYVTKPVSQEVPLRKLKLHSVLIDLS